VAGGATKAGPTLLPPALFRRHSRDSLPRIHAGPTGAAALDTTCLLNSKLTTAGQGVVTLIEMGGEDCVPIVGKLIQPVKGTRVLQVYRACCQPAW
jgi:hypothetical protein